MNERTQRVLTFTIFICMIHKKPYRMSHSQEKRKQKKQLSLEEVLGRIQKINETTVQSQIVETGPGHVSMRNNTTDIEEDLPLGYSFGKKRITANQICRIINMVRHFPESFVWIKTSERKSRREVILIYSLVCIHSIQRIEEKETCRLCIAFHEKIISGDSINVMNGLEMVTRDAKNKERIKEHGIQALKCKSPVLGSGY